MYPIIIFVLLAFVNLIISFMSGIFGIHVSIALLFALNSAVIIAHIEEKHKSDK